LTHIPKNSPTFTGDPKAPTASATDDDTSIATTGHVKDAIEAAAHCVKVYRSSALSHTSSGSFQAITFNAELFDTSSMHDNVTNGNRLVAPVDGVYLIQAQAVFALDTSGYRLVSIFSSGGTELARSAPFPATVTALNGNVGNVQVHCLAELAAADYVSINAYQNSGGNLAYQIGNPDTNDNRTWASMQLVHSGPV
jgi:hypothetical protein